MAKKVTDTELLKVDTIASDNSIIIVSNELQGVLATQLNHIPILSQVAKVAEEVVAGLNWHTGGDQPNNSIGQNGDTYYQQNTDDTISVFIKRPLPIGWQYQGYFEAGSGGGGGNGNYWDIKGTPNITTDNYVGPSNVPFLRLGTSEGHAVEIISGAVRLWKRGYTANGNDKKFVALQYLESLNKAGIEVFNYTGDKLFDGLSLSLNNGDISDEVASFDDKIIIFKKRTVAVGGTINSDNSVDGWSRNWFSNRSAGPLAVSTVYVENDKGFGGFELYSSNVVPTFNTLPNMLRVGANFNLTNGIQIYCSNNSPITFCTAGTEKGRFDGNGNFGVGTDSPLESIHTAGDVIIDGPMRGDFTAFVGMEIGNKLVKAQLPSVENDRVFYDGGFDEQTKGPAIWRVLKWGKSFDWSPTSDIRYTLPMSSTGGNHFEIKIFGNGIRTNNVNENFVIEINEGVSDNAGILSLSYLSTKFNYDSLLPFTVQSSQFGSNPYWVITIKIGNIYYTSAKVYSTVKYLK